MNQTDKLLANIGAIRTMLENFPDNFFDRDGKTYDSAFDFLMDILRACNMNDKKIVAFLIEKIYGYEGKTEFTINGLYEVIKRGNIVVDMQNPFISGLEDSIKVVLMGLFTGLFTCSALPVFGNGVFDYDAFAKQTDYGLVALMDENAQRVTKRGDQIDKLYKIKVPIPLIDTMKMFSISPASSQGSLYYLTEGKDTYYKKYVEKTPFYNQVMVHLNAGESYIKRDKKYDSEYMVEFNLDENNLIFFKFKKQDNGHFVDAAPPIDLRITINYIDGQIGAQSSVYKDISTASTKSETFPIHSVYDTGTGEEIKTEICSISVNGFQQGCDIGNEGECSWVYISGDDSAIEWWNSHGKELSDGLWGYSRIDETEDYVTVAEVEGNYECIISGETEYWKYKSETGVSNPMAYVRYSYVPENVNSASPEYIVCYDGMDPNLVYRAYDMNAFLWYCCNRSNVSSQIEQNHLMWDSRITASKQNIKREEDIDWNKWYSSKNVEGAEFKYNSGAIYPIIQVEKYKFNSNELLVRIPSQRYFLPAMKQDLLSESYDVSKHYMNASIYKFDYEYLQNIQILNPKLLLVRLVENLIGFGMDVASSINFDINKRKIESVLSKVVTTVIEANDMEIEDCWKSFSNEAYDEMLSEMLLEKYTASPSTDESNRIRVHNVFDYNNKLDEVNANVTSEGTTTMITRTVTEIMKSDEKSDNSEESFDVSYDMEFDSNMLKKLMKAITMPIVESLFTPQVMLLLAINLKLLGAADINDVASAFDENSIDYTKILDILVKKIFTLIKSIVLLVKNKILQLLMEMLNEILTPMLKNAMLLICLENINNWLSLLREAVQCIPLMSGITGGGRIGYIEDVDYADIVNEQTIPESMSEC